MRNKKVLSSLIQTKSIHCPKFMMTLLVRFRLLKVLVHSLTTKCFSDGFRRRDIRVKKQEVLRCNIGKNHIGLYLDIKK